MLRDGRLMVGEARSRAAFAMSAMTMERQDHWRRTAKGWKVGRTLRPGTRVLSVRVPRMDVIFESPSSAHVALAPQATTMLGLHSSNSARKRSSSGKYLGSR